MCGIGGIIDWQGDAVTEQELRLLQSSLRHRGPDANGTWCAPDGRAGLAHTRLAILDLSAEANQPMMSASGRQLIVYNGEIYNFIELRDELEAGGCQFRTQSDTEVLLRGWARWGDGLFDRLNGMWALAIYDTESGSLLLCRDRYGVKPLYFHVEGGRLVFASEVQAIDRLLGYRLLPNPEWTARIGRLDAAAHTCLQNVEPLPAGCRLDQRADGERQLRRWYRLATVAVPESLPAQAKLLRGLVADACRLRLRSDVPVATCLSGGVDSGSLVSLLHTADPDQLRFPGFNHRAFTAAFPNTNLDESENARLLAQRFDVSLDQVPISAPSPSELETAMAATDGPTATLAFYPIWRLYRHIRQQGVVVTLDGIGPDEALGGYYLGAEAMAAALKARRPLRFLDCYRTYAALYPDVPEWVRRDLQQVLKTGLARQLRGWRSGGCQGWEHGAVLPDAVPADHPQRGDPLALALWRQQFVAPLPFFLHQYDRASMASGVECRMPFLDYRVVEYLFSLPLESRIGGGYTKRVLREAMRGLLPDEIRLNRRKLGFNAPFQRWLRGPLREWALDLCGSAGFRESSLFDGIEQGERLRSALTDESAPCEERALWPVLHAALWSSQRRRAA